jgi:hypothetical protein
MAKHAIELQAALNFVVALLRLQAVVGREDAKLVAPELEGVHDLLATKVVRARVVWRIEVRQNQDSHSVGADDTRSAAH